MLKRSLLMLPLTLATSAAWASAPLLGDFRNGEKLLSEECTKLTGQIQQDSSDQMNLILPEALQALVKTHCSASLGYLDRWDVVAALNTRFMPLQGFFPKSSRYLAKRYAMDKFGLKRVSTATKKPIKAFEASVFTFFQFPGEEGAHRYVPQDPIQLDHLKKDNKIGYLVFVPFDLDGAQEIGVAMDPSGVITRLEVHGNAHQALNTELARFAGQGKKGQSQPFATEKRASKREKKLSQAVFRAYMLAMESATMYDREERERTWADDAVK